MNTFGQPIPVRDATGEIIGDRPSEVSRLTKNALGGCYGSDKSRKLVVSLRDGDIVAFRPAGTRREVTATALDLYAAVVRWQANRVNLEKARERKAKKAEQRINARIARADAKMKREAKLLKAKGGA